MNFCFVLDWLRKWRGIFQLIKRTKAIAKLLSELKNRSNTLTFSGVRDFRDLLDESKVWNLNENKRVQLVYVLQSEYFLKASSEFLDVSKEYMQVHDFDALKKQVHLIARVLSYKKEREKLEK